MKDEDNPVLVQGGQGRPDLRAHDVTPTMIVACVVTLVGVAILIAIPVALFVLSW